MVSFAAAVHIDTNFVLHPQHPDFSKTRIGTAEACAYDLRLLNKKTA